MKKVLFGTTALLAASMISGSASASEPVKLGLGGYMNWYAVSANQDNDYTKAFANNDATKKLNTLDVMGDSEIYFQGATTLDNGVKVAVQVQVEAGTGDTTKYGNRSDVDETFATVDTAYGRVIVGSTDNVAVQQHVSAPEVGVLGVEETEATNSLLIPAAVTALDATWLNTDGDSNKISYVTPTIYGFTLGASFVPGSRSTEGDDNTIVQTSFEDAYVLSAAYAGEFYGVGTKFSTGFLDANVGAGTGANDVSTKNHHKEYSFGTNLSYAGFTLGGGYRVVDAAGNKNTTLLIANEASFDGRSWDAGLSYENGPYGVSVNYFNSEVEGDSNTVVNRGRNDKVERFLVSGKYNLGAGVDSFVTFAYQAAEDELHGTAGQTVQQNRLGENNSWAVMTGVGLKF